MRLIDADALLEELKKLEASGGSNMYRKSLNDALHYFFPKIIGEMPTITPPLNAPLTLEELRELDGMPVWCVVNELPEKGYYCLCDRGVILAPSGSIFDCEDILNWVFYRRRPEEGGDSNA